MKNNESFNILNNGLLDKISLKKKISFLIISVALIIFLVCTVVFTYFQINNTLLESQRSKTASITQIALSLIKEYKLRAEKGEFSQEEAQKKAMARISNLHFDGDNYFWVVDYNYKFLVHPKLQGKNGSEIKDKNNYPIVREAVKLARSMEEVQ